MYLQLGKINIEGSSEIKLPKMFKVKQQFEATAIPKEKIQMTLSKEFEDNKINERIKPGMKIAVAVGSRGITNLLEIVKCAIDEIKKLGAVPFIVPAMGSHGGATKEGQIEVLKGYGITEESVRVEIKSSMETVHLGKVLNDVDVYFDKIAYKEADGIIVVARIKPHTDFKGSIESGVLKMLSIGLGKHKGASYLHKGGMDSFAEIIPKAGMYIAENVPFLFGVTTIENAYEETAHLKIIVKEELLQKEAELLKVAKACMPKIMLDAIDVLVVDEIGKNISGGGMDSNIIGRSAAEVATPFDAPSIQRVIVLGLTEETKGNAAGIGLADLTTKAVVEKINFPALYTNVVTDIELTGGKLPVISPNDHDALITGMVTARKRDVNDVTVVRIKNTLEIGEIYVSENMIPEIKNNPSLSIIEGPVDWSFDCEGYVAF